MSYFGYASLHENRVRTLPSWSSLNPLHGSCPLTITLVLDALNHFLEIFELKCLPRPLLEISHSFPSGRMARGSFHNISSKNSLNKAVLRLRSSNFPCMLFILAGTPP